MPSGNPPSRNLSLYLVRSLENQLGAFGPEFQEITRLGLTSQRFSQTTPRGDTVQVQAIHFMEGLTETTEFIDFVEGLQSYELNLISTSTEKEWMVFLRRVTATYMPIVDTGRGNYMIRFTLELQRTK